MAELRFVAQRRAAIHALVVARGSDPNIWPAYVRLAERLPQLLRQHGLRLTMDYLHLRANTRNDAEATALLNDWAASGGQGQLALATLLNARLAPAANAAAAMLRLQALALADAAQFRHSCKLVESDPPAAGSAHSPGAGQWPRLPAHPALSHSACRHPGIAWRHVGHIAGNAEKTYRTEQIRQVVHNASADHVPSHHKCYSAAYQRRQRWLAAQGVQTAQMALRSHLFIALGERGVWETHTLLHPTTGMPYLPASQIKNLVRRSMAARISRMPDAGQRLAMAKWLNALLGQDVPANAKVQTSQGGMLVLHDAWWVPGSATSPLVGDIDNNHHTAYYQHKADRARPSDSPQPHPQLAVCGSLLFALGIQPQTTVDAAQVVARCLRWLQQALAERGIGGRSFAVGAGRFNPASHTLTGA